MPLKIRLVPREQLIKTKEPSAENFKATTVQKMVYLARIFPELPSWPLVPFSCWFDPEVSIEKQVKLPR